MTDPAANPPTLAAAALFETVAARHAARIAVADGARTLSYPALAATASSVAERLAAQRPAGAGRVALLIDNRAAATAAMLGVLRAGHAYVPLDPADPPHRIGQILGECEPLALITDNENLVGANALIPDSCALINMDRLAAPAAGAAAPAVPLDALAYIFYTSGSSGQPKGVCQSHRNLLQFVGHYMGALDIRPGDRLSLLFSLSFGAASLDIFPALFAGATICPYDMRRHGVPRLAEWIDRERISILHIGPTALRELARNLPSGRNFASVRAVVLGGETLFSDDIEAARRHFPANTRFINNFAATEAGIVAQHAIEPGQTPAPGRIPAGRRPHGVEVRILRPDGSPADTGEDGEIVIRGTGISPGYWRRDELTATVFADDPRHPGWRIYRSGDLGRIDADGNLHFLGRQGTRIKLRGHSVDLAEVESALRRCPGVRDACVTAPRSADGREPDRLVAHVACAADGDRDPRRLRRDLARLLPHYMLPSAFLFREALPLTATGKIDRSALAALDVPAAMARSEPYAEPADDLERAIASVYEKILKHAPVGRNDDFFLSGGDSMSAVELQVELAAQLRRDVPLKDLFEDATVAGVAESVRRLAPAATSAERRMPVIVPLREHGREPVLFLVHGRQGLAPVSPRFLELTGPDQALYVFQARGLDGIERPNRTIDAMAAEYTAAARRIQPRGPYLLAGLCAGGYITIEMARLLRSAGETVLPLLLIDPPVPRFTMEQSTRFLSHFAATVRGLIQHGRVRIDINNPDRRATATLVAKCMEFALIHYRPRPYPGPVYLLASRERLGAGDWGDEAMRRSVFGGELQCIEVGVKHIEALDVHGEAFVRGFTDALRRIRAAADAPGADARPAIRPDPLAEGGN